MSHALPARPDIASSRPPLILLALLFGVATYGILSLRAELSPDLNDGIAQLRRLVATAGGAALFWLILRRLDAPLERPKPGPVELVATIVAAGAGLLAVRIGFGWLFQDYGVSLAKNLRWTIVWAGYFGAGIGLFLAYQLRAANRGSVAAAERASTNVATPASSDLTEAVDWVADALIAEFAVGDVAGRRDLADRLLSRTGYRVADPLGHGNNRRIEIMERLATRLAK